MIELRDIIESDIEDYVRWFTVDTEWDNWDAPWEPLDPSTPEHEHARWTRYYHNVQAKDRNEMRWRFEIVQDGRHIGWVSSYTDTDYYPNPDELPAIGITIVDPAGRSKGAGTEALRLFIAYLKGRGYPAAYTQTWSGNLPMIRVAEKLGFREVCRKVGFREVRGEKYDAVTFRLDF